MRCLTFATCGRASRSDTRQRKTPNQRAGGTARRVTDVFRRPRPHSKRGRLYFNGQPGCATLDPRPRCGSTFRSVERFWISSSDVLSAGMDRLPSDLILVILHKLALDPLSLLRSTCTLAPLYRVTAENPKFWKECLLPRILIETARQLAVFPD